MYLEYLASKTSPSIDQNNIIPSYIMFLVLWETCMFKFECEEMFDTLLFWNCLWFATLPINNFVDIAPIQLRNDEDPHIIL